MNQSGLGPNLWWGIGPQDEGAGEDGEEGGEDAMEEEE